MHAFVQEEFAGRRRGRRRRRLYQAFPEDEHHDQFFVHDDEDRRLADADAKEAEAFGTWGPVLVVGCAGATARSVASIVKALDATNERHRPARADDEKDDREQ